MRQGTRLTDFLLPLAVISVVGMMIFPLPAAVLDLLLICNISFSIALLITSIYLSQPERFTALPSILLLSTLFRLGLNISTTRQLLGFGIAPEIVLSFGNFVVAGNFVVGAVVFIIVTIVQFLVIAKGAERVAEVAARFTLDAMPGKQMAIDADVRAGMLSLEQAKEKRRELHRESKLYGALDGAMKFVKGDAIAGLLITIINIGAGFVIGVSQLGLDVSEALKRYTLFTIGDGLVSQIPALLVAVAAGIVVTRVEDVEGSFVGRDVLRQLAREPQALVVTATVLFILAALPSIPALPFLLVGVIFCIAARQVSTRQRREHQQQTEVEFRPKVFSPVVLKLSREATPLLQREAQLPGQFQSFRTLVFEERGIVLPNLQFDLDQNTPGVFATLFFHGVRVRGVLASANGEITSCVMKMIQEFASGHYPEFIDDTQTRILLETHQPVAEDIINSLIPSVISVTALTTVLRELVKDEVSIREFRRILQAIAEYHLYRPDSGQGLGGKSPAKIPLANHDSLPEHLRRVVSEVRMALRRNISKSVSDENWRVKGVVVEPSLDYLLSRLDSANASLEPRVAQALLERSRSLIETHGQFVFITTRAARASLQALLREEEIKVRVIAVDELCKEVNLEVLEELSVGGSVSSVVEEIEGPRSEGKVTFLERKAA